MNNYFLKTNLVRLYHSKLGAKIWTSSVTFARRPFIKRALTKFIQDVGIIGTNGSIRQDDVLSTDITYKQKHHVLIVFPWAGMSASYEYVKMFAYELKELGFVVHALQYSDFLSMRKEDCFDFIYGIKSNNPNFGNHAIHKDYPQYEKNEVDDWIDVNLLTSVERLNSLYNFEFCFCSYLFLSSVFSRTPQAIKVLLACDDFESRNKKLYEAGVSEDKFSFSCSKYEQQKAFNRADYIFAIQESEAKKFQSYGLSRKIYVAPYIPKVQGLDSVLSASDRIRVGYLASGHYPNVIAIKRFIKNLLSSDASVDLYIGGSICNQLTIPQDSHIHLLGLFENVNDFYKQCDILINPDTLESGIKIKTIEAIAYGLPLICTKAASTGIETDYAWHLCKDEAECADWIVRICNGEVDIDMLREASREVYAGFEKKYSIYHLLRDIYNAKEKSEYLSTIVTPHEQAPSVSVIIPVYNVERYFEQALLSVLNQDLKNIEIIPIDNGSKDRCGLLMDEYARKDSRVKPIHKTENVGYGAAINLGLKAATGEYIAILEPDDWVEPDMYGKLYAYANGAEIIKAGFYKHFNSGHVSAINLFSSFCKLTTVDKTILVPSFEPKLVVGESSIWSAIYRRDFLLKNDLWMMETPGASYQDMVWKFMVYVCSKSVTLLDENFYHYRYLTPTSSSKSGKNPEVMFKNYNFLYSYLKSRSVFEEWKDSLYTHAFLDFIFHRNRLAPQYLPKFKELGKQFILQAERDGCSMNDLSQNKLFRDFMYPEVIETYKWIKSSTK